MPSYSLANWDGSLSRQNQQVENNSSPAITSLVNGPNIATALSHGQSISITDASIPKEKTHRPSRQDTEGTSSGSFQPNVLPIPTHTLPSKPNTDISTIFDEDVHIIQDENNAPTILKRDAIDHGEDEDIMLVDELLGWYPPLHNCHVEELKDQEEPAPAVNSSKPQSEPSQKHTRASSSVYEISPPPMHPMKSLFTPSPSPAPRRVRQLMSHVAVPSWPKGRSKADYLRKPRKKRRPPAEAQVHPSLSDVLQSAWNHNVDVDVSYTTAIKVRRPAHKNAIAGPSSIAGPISVSAAENVKRKHQHASQGHTKKTKPPMDEFYAHEAITRKLSPPRPRDLVHATYAAQGGAIRLHISRIPHEHSSVIWTNTRFARRQDTLGKGQRSKEDIPFTLATRSISDRRCWDKPSNSESLDGAEAELSVGGYLSLPDDVSGDEESIFLPNEQQQWTKPYTRQPTADTLHSPILESHKESTLPRSKPKVGHANSQTISYTNSKDHHTTNPPTNKDAGHNQFSVKVLGKQRARSPITHSQNGIHNHPPNSPTISETEAFLTGEHSSRSAGLSNLSPYAPFGGHGSPSKSFQFVSTEDRDSSSQSLFVQGSISSNVAGLHTGLDDGASSEWLDPMLLDHVPFGDGTIDPSLLGGYHSAEDDFAPPHPSVSPSPPRSHLSSPRSSRHLSSPISSHSRSPSSLSSSDSSHSGPSASPRRFLRPHNQSRNIPHGMVPSGDLDLSSSSSDEDDQGTTRPPKFSPVKATQSPSGKPTKPKRQLWPHVSEKEFCHQCRGSSTIRKAICVCGKKYCVRCLSTRYNGEVLFNPSVLEFTCPHCNDACSCDICTRKRGEVYVPLRPRIDTKKINNEDHVAGPSQPVRVRLGGKTNLPPRKVEGPVKYWGAMYDVTGARIGQAFVGSSGNEELVVVRRETRVKKRKRVFVGKLQTAWGLGDNPLLKDLEPLAWMDRINGPHERFYVGTKALLYKPVASKGECYAYDDDPPSPLTSLEDDSDAAGEGESRVWPLVRESDSGFVQEDLNLFLEKGPRAGFSPDSLDDHDITRAITLGLLACGVGVQLLTC